MTTQAEQSRITIVEERREDVVEKKVRGGVESFGLDR